MRRLVYSLKIRATCSGEIATGDPKIDYSD